MDIKRSGAFIAALRKDEGLTQKQLADELGVTDKAVSRWETGNGLPDAATLLALSDRFGVSVNELLLGERVTAVEATVQTAESNMVGVLQLYDGEKRKSRRNRAVIVAICVLVAVVMSVILFPPVVAEICGDGRSLSAMYYTHVARKTVRLMEKGEYDRAVKRIGFVGFYDPEAAREQWVDAATEIFSDELKMISFEIVIPMIEDDEFLFGEARLTVEDMKTSQIFVSDIAVYQQDGIAFAYVYPAPGTTNRDNADRANEIQLLFRKNLSTYYPG